MDHIEKEFDFDGYHCVITFTEIGYMCGYIQLHEDDYLYGKHFQDINDNRILTIPLSYTGRTFPKNDDNYWIGFTCDNKGDKPDVERVKKLWGNNAIILTFLKMYNIPLLPKDGTIRTVEYVEDRLRRLVLEIKKCNEATESLN